MSPKDAMRTGVQTITTRAGPIFNLDNELYPGPWGMANEFREKS